MQDPGSNPGSSTNKCLRRVEHITMLEVYTAGFLDADGSVSLAKHKTGAEWMRTPTVEFYNCDKGILDKISERWGGNIGSKKPNTPNSNVSYELRIGGNKALKLLDDVAPHMLHSKKGRRARLIVEHYRNCTPRNGKYTPEQIEKKKWLTEEVMGIVMRGKGAY
jgi:hypothetical protein